jgi:hypothetical protein
VSELERSSDLILAQSRPCFLLISLTPRKEATYG